LKALCQMAHATLKIYRTEIKGGTNAKSRFLEEN
jgi:hypothetical protein